MSSLKLARRSASDFLSAIQFLTRIPVPSLKYDPDSLLRAVTFFPAVGLLIGSAAALLHLLLSPHFSRLVTALLIVIFLVVITGCFHEDGLADVADGFGGGLNREQVLMILRDSRIGSYGGAALSLSLLARVLLLASLPLADVSRYLIAAHVLCRWTTLGLSYCLPPARNSDNAEAGLGVRIARLTSRKALVVGSLFTVVVTIFLLRSRAAATLLATALVTVLSGLYYRRRIQGVTGDCFGATNQLAEIAVYLTGAWIA